MRGWTQEENRVLARDYGRKSAPVIARALGRSARAVYNQAQKLGLVWQSRVVIDARFRRRVRRLNREGLPDTEIARLIGCERHTVTRQRQAMGLPENKRGEHWRRKVGEAARRQCAAAGVRNLAELKSKLEHEAVAALGWPADLRPRHVEILETLMARGPMTRPELAQAIGLPWIGNRNSMKARAQGGTWLAELQRRGLVVRVPKARASGNGPGYRRDLYLVPLWVWQRKGVLS